MRRRLAIALPLVLGALLLGWWASTRPEPAPPPAPEPAPAPALATAPAPRVQRPAPRTYHLRPPHTPEPVLLPEPAAEVQPLDREAAFALVRAGDRALGTGWQTCVRPTLPEDSWDLPPLVLNLVVLDGQVVDLELMSPIDLDPDLLACFADAAWTEVFPEDPTHRGEVRVQRTLGLKR